MAAENANNSNCFCSVQDFENYAYKTLPRSVLDYYRSGACSQQTLRNNQESFTKLRIRPRCLRDVTLRDTKTKVLGMDFDIPIGVSPSAMQKMAHPDGEIGNARAAGSVGAVYILSTLSTTSLEEVARGAPNTVKWFQLYIYKDRKETEKLVKRAESAGYKALVLTVDANVFGLRYADARNAFQMPSHLKFGNFGDLKSKFLDRSNGSGLKAYIDLMFDEGIQWKDVKWLKTITKLPIIVKGVLIAEDALTAIEHGAVGIMVSNHGGRQLDTAPSSIEALPEIVKAVDGRVDVYLDGGVRYGTDVFKALALGAKMVFIGRPALWGLAHSGEEGVKKVLQILINELKNTMGLVGCNKLADMEKDMVVHKSFYHKL
ncbi:hypothetical protein V9T40_001803 [Parthenolecanium corni]|uniref:(S)-2-hydroxy-acid oxidase n=1 Tax=Parthenolecanium corni TaxID=536013 RepID=A0AAN9Y4R0_9HEMI